MDASSTNFFLDAPLNKADVGPTRMAWRRFGNGPALLLVHGFPLSGFTWRKVLPALSQQFTCYVPDLAGMGDTEWSEHTEFSWKGHAQALKTLADQQGLQKYSVLAHDTGGTIARYLALADERVDKLALINTEVPNHRPPWIPLYQMSLRLPGSLAIFRQLMKSRAFRRSGMGFGGCFCNLDLIDGEFHQHVVVPLLESKRRLEGMGKYLGGLYWNWVDQLAVDHAKLAMPVQLIWGADDPTFPIEEARAMVKQFPKARLTEISGGKLLVHEEKPQAVVDAALKFVRA
ncbi:MAG TPA: alpha/beta hydrolase [Nevskiaceae bacterium]|nr:alpha/beta hydrolase [Nevskiaceae bacterium]